MSKYYSQAQKQYDKSYNQKVTAEKNKLNQNIYDLDGQKKGINSNYDDQVKKQNLTNVYNKNSLSNSMLGRGLGNSSIAVTGIAEQNNINQRMVGDINTSRTGELNEVERQKRLTRDNYNNTLAGMKADRTAGIQDLAMKLEDRDRDWKYKQSQLQLERDKLNAEKEYRNQQLALERQKMAQAQAQARASRSYGGYGGSSGGYSGEADPRALSDLKKDLYGKNVYDQYLISKKYSNVYGGVPGYQDAVSHANSIYKKQQNMFNSAGSSINFSAFKKKK